MLLSFTCSSSSVSVCSVCLCVCVCYCVCGGGVCGWVGFWVGVCIVCCCRASTCFTYNPALTADGVGYVVGKAPMMSLSDFHMAHVECVVQLKQAGSQPPSTLRGARYAVHKGGCRCVFSLVDIFNIAGLTCKNGKASLWVQGRTSYV